jgi:branched-chain amino acid transport system substrate-binding protein
MKKLKTLLMASAAIGLAGTAQADIKIGLAGDMSGKQSALAGPGSQVAVEMAIEDMGGEVLGEPITLVIGDNQHKAELEASIARRWYEDEDVDAIVGINLSSGAIETVHLAERFDKVAMVSDAGSSRLVQEDCTPNHVHWGWNTYSFSAVVPKAMVEKGNDKFFFLTVDYTFGHDMMADATTNIEAAGGSVVGSVLHPLGANDFSAYILQAQASGASVVPVINSGADTVATIKQAGEFGVLDAGTPVIVPMIFTLADVEALGLEATKNLRAPSSFYWGRDDESRAWSEKFKERFGKMPTFFQAQAYSATYHYLKAVEKAGTKDAKTVIKTLKSMEINDFFAKNAYVREDGQLVHDMYLVRVKTPEESEGEFDFFEVEATISGDDAYQPMDPEACKLLQD